MVVFYYSMLAMFLVLAFVLCFVIMIQEGKGSSLGAFFGGDAQDALFGVATADVLKKFTAYMATAFMILSLLLSFWTAAIGETAASAKNSTAQVESTGDDS